jgi:CheY-like chemotaxis protein
MTPNAEIHTTSVLLIDDDCTNRIGFANHLRGCSPDYHILEARDGAEGLALYRSQRIDCVVLELDLLDRSGFAVLKTLIPRGSRPRIAVIVLTKLTDPGLWELARKNGAYVCFAKQHTTGEDLDRAIQRAMAFVGQMPKEDRHQPV